MGALANTPAAAIVNTTPYCLATGQLYIFYIFTLLFMRAGAYFLRHSLITTSTKLTLSHHNIGQPLPLSVYVCLYI